MSRRSISSSSFFGDKRTETLPNASAEPITFRTLKPLDYRAFRAIRLDALGGKDARYFGASYEAEAAQSSSAWRERCRPTRDKALFGAFLHGRIVGVMAATKSQAHENTVLWGSVYLQPRYRLQHVAEKLYRMRQEWSEAGGQFTRAIFFIREGNERSAAIHIKNGARITHREEMTFADHSRATALWFEKKLRMASAVALPRLQRA